MTKLKVNPLAKAIEDHGPVVIVSGFIGRAEDGRVKLYPRLKSNSTMEFDEKDVVYSIEGATNEQPTRLFLTETATVTITTKVSAASIPGTAESVPDKACADASFDFWWRCIMAGHDIDFCTEGSRWVEDACNQKSGAPATGPATTA